MRIGVGVVLALLLAGAATWAWAQDGDTIYHACVNNSSGTIFMVDGPEDCHTNETYISWNQVGPTGPMGPQGPAGETGPQGEPGPQGVLGFYQKWETPQLPINDWGRGGIHVDCNPGDVAVGGGFRNPVGTLYGIEYSARVRKSSPYPENAVAGFTGWNVGAELCPMPPMTIVAWIISGEAEKVYSCTQVIVHVVCADMP